MIQDLRKYTDNFAFKLLLGFLSLTFVISFGVGSFFGARKEVVARVDETEILARDYQRMYNQQLNSLRQRLGDNADQIAQQLNLRQQVFSQLIDRQLLLNTAESMNLQVTDLEVQEYIRQQPFFQKEGRFDFETYQAILSQNRIPVEEYETSLRMDLLLQKKQQLLTAGIILSERDVEQRFRLQHEQVEVRFLELAPSAFYDQVEVSLEEARAYYDENPNDFQTEPAYRVDYFTLRLADVTNADEVRERAVRRYYERNADAYTTPTQVRARHILLRLSAEADEVLRLEKRKQLEDLKQQLEAGADFATLAEEYSQDGTSANGGDLGWFSPGEMVPAFENAAFALEAGQVSDVVESPFGMHLIKVEERRESTQQELEEVREDIVATLAEELAQRSLDEARDTFRATFDTKSLNAWAQQYDQEVTTSDRFAASDVIPQLGSAQGLVRMVAAQQQGAHDVWVRNPSQGYVFYQLKETRDPERRPFEEVQREAEQAVREQKAQQFAASQAQEWVKKLQDQTATLDEYAAQLGREVVTTAFNAETRFLPEVGDNPAFREQALQLDADHRAAMSVHEGRTDLLVFERRFVDVENAASLRSRIRNELRQELREAITSKQIEALRADAVIEIVDPAFQSVGG
jgi:peptidyl-prolyl cis-trans isomerase D